MFMDAVMEYFFMNETDKSIKVVRKILMRWISRMLQNNARDQKLLWKQPQKDTTYFTKKKSLQNETKVFYIEMESYIPMQNPCEERLKKTKVVSLCFSRLFQKTPGISSSQNNNKGEIIFLVKIINSTKKKAF